MSLKRTLASYWKLARPRIWTLLTFTGIVSMLVAYRETMVAPSIGTIVPCFIALTLGSASAEVLTNYHDRDVDSMMKRTMKRPLPSGEVSPRSALLFGLVMAIPSVLIPLAFINVASAGFMVAGLFVNIIIYSLLLKRRCWLNIVLGGISGGMPVMVGYSAVPTANPFAPIALYMFALVVIWIPTHVWSLAIFSRSDYEAAKIPMLPVVFGDRVATVCIAGTSALLAFFSLAIFLFTHISIFYTISALVLGAIVLTLSAKLAIDQDLHTAWTLFKITSPYLALIFLLLCITVWV
jgi:protoheme IX farnesyltransferase